MSHCFFWTTALQMTNPGHKRKGSSGSPEPEEPTTRPQSNFITPRGKRPKPSVIQDKGKSNAN
ncbi:hypothetical protein LPJ71_005963 [Coemansia sp. S17]|nr:hypothetical protein LPJ71_005963 [Coemansia sp. S17]